MTTCPSCGTENPDGQKFCGECGTQLVEPTRSATEERKVVTTLFCDLVGFTAASESADPEDLDRMLAEYFAAARKEVEAFGGIVEKFIGDAVVGVFGVPAAHEDDPERAVRAGLRICEVAEDLTSVGDVPLRLRVGINTGEAFVRLGVTPGSGEGFFAGDAVNTASRLQAVAPEMGVAVGIGTYEATSAVFDYKELEPAALKGKAEPVRVFWAKAPRSRIGTDLTRTHTTPFIGREIDLAILRGVFDKTRASNAPQLVLVVGEPGIGKSRLVAELRASVGELPDLVTWRQGRCLPYGEGITFWALGEILKAHAGILESDDSATARGKLELVLPEGDERAWFRQRLLPLLGIEATSTAEREELFTAWRRFLEHIAERDPPCWCSRTCTGRIRRCWRSWSTLPIAPKAFRCSSSAPPARSCSSVTRILEHAAQRHAGRTRSPLGAGDRAAHLGIARRTAIPPRCRRRSWSARAATRSTPRSSCAC